MLKILLLKELKYDFGFVVIIVFDQFIIYYLSKDASCEIIEYRLLNVNQKFVISKILITAICSNRTSNIKVLLIKSSKTHK